MRGSGLSHRGEECLVAALSVLPLLPFLDAAVSIDAPVFLAVSRQILSSPGDPFGFEMIWDPVSPHAALFNQNPPLLSYYLAPWVGFFGEVETALHAALLPFPLIAGLSFLGIARRVLGAGLAPAALLVASPAFLVLASALMLDVPMLALFLFSVYALIRTRESDGFGWPLLGGLAAAAAGLMKYVGLSVAPLLAVGVWLLLRRRVPAAVALLGVPLALWTAWGLWTAHLYGHPHFLGGTELVADKNFDPDHFWNQLVSAPIYFGAALLFPIFCFARALVVRTARTELAVLGVLLGTAAVTFALPEGDPPRRYPLEPEEAVLAAFGLAGACVVWGSGLRPARWLAGPMDRFLAIWLGGFALYSLLLNWHVNAADALLAAPPALLLLFRAPELRPSPRLAAIWAGLSLLVSLGLTWAEMAQANAYREMARLVADEIGERPGNRWFVGHWGLQYYLEREGFSAVAPPQYGPAARSELERDDWVVTARNLTQLDVSQTLMRHRMRRVWTWEQTSPLPLRTNNPDAGAGLYSHHVGYVPFAWHDGAIETLSLARVTGRRSGALVR